jgi:RHS repeat-associated protein
VNRTNTWAYDPLYRLTNEVIGASSGPTGSITNQYDAVGNRTIRASSVTGVSSGTNTYNSNDQLTTDTYDNNGNTTNSASIPYQYDVENHLTNYNSGAATFVHDGDGNRVRKITASTTNYYLIDDRNPTGYAQVLEELTTVGSTPANLYTYGLDLISQRQSSGTTSFYGYDGNGNVRFLTATNATISDTYTYDAFGILITNTGTTPNNYRYTGEQYDPNLGFYYLRARYMNPNTGRFWTRDTHEGNIFDPPNLHKYTYCGDNPINCTDPSGHEGLGTVLTVTAVLIVVATVAVIAYSLSTSKAAKTIAIANALLANSRVANEVDILYLDIGFAKIGSQKLNEARDAIHDGTTVAYIVENGSMKHGAHVQLLKGKIFIPISAFRRGPDVAAFYAFGEFQHDTLGGNLSEKEAQRQIDEIIKTLQPPYNTWRVRHGEE